MFAGTQVSKDDEFTKDQESYHNTLECEMNAEDEIITFFEKND